MDIKIIKSPTQGTINMLNRRMAGDITSKFPTTYDTIGLIQGKLIDMVIAADIAEKAADVYIEEIRGLCPQHFLLLAVFGDTSSVEAALKAIKEELS
jgi:ethanolamine utilization microcompartment shell protein EutS